MTVLDRWLVAAMSAVAVAVTGCSDPMQVRGTSDFAVAPVADLRFDLHEREGRTLLRRATVRNVVRLHAKASGFSGKAEATVGSFPPEETTGDIAFFNIRAGFEFAEVGETYEIFSRIDLLGHSYERYDTTVGGLPETYSTVAYDSGVDILGFGVGLGMTLRLSEKVGLTVAGSFGYDNAGVGEAVVRLEFRATPRLAISVGYTEYQTDAPVEDSAGTVADLKFKSRCLATGVVCRF